MPLWYIASKNRTDRSWVFLSYSALCCVCMQAPTHQGPEVSLVLTVQGLWLTCTDPAARIRLWATTSVLQALSLALGLAPASQWVLSADCLSCLTAPWAQLPLVCQNSITKIRHSANAHCLWLWCSVKLFNTRLSYRVERTNYRILYLSTELIKIATTCLFLNLIS